MPRGNKSMKKVKIKKQNEKIIETSMDIWHYTYGKTFIRVRRKKCCVSNRMIYL